VIGIVIETTSPSVTSAGCGGLCHDLASAVHNYAWPELSN
jgi:hypothetical protein